MRTTGRSTAVRPSWLWFLLLDGGIVILARLVFSDEAYRRAAQLSNGALPPRGALRALLGATAVIHVTEAIAAGRMARRRGLAPAGWSLQTLVVGFPSLLALRKNEPGPPPSA
jgi:Transmembrane protein 254